MASTNSRKRILLLLKLLYEKTDEEHPLTTSDIFSYLREQGITLDRKTFREDITFLIEEMGFDIVMIKSSPNKYFWGERKFELPELKLLIDAVSSSQFINKTKSKVMIDKLMTLVSEGQQEQLVRNVFGTGKRKSDNKRICYIVDTINDAINQKKKIQFKYYEYNSIKEKVFRNNGEVYTISPYALYWNEDNYYMVGYSDKRQTVTAFRVDRLYNLEIIEAKAEKKPKGFSISDYGNKIFQMFGGEETIVQLECKNELMKYIIDKFGLGAETEEKTDETFVAKVPVELSPTFYGWVFQFAGKMKIIGPAEAVEQFSDMINLSSR